MGIRNLFNSTWDQVYRSAVEYKNSDVFPDQRIIIINRNIGKLLWGQLIMMFDEDGKACLVTSRFCVPQLSLPAYLHTLEQAKRIRSSGIVCNVAFEKGLVTCTYSRVGWLERVARASSVSACAASPPPQQPQTP